MMARGAALFMFFLLISAQGFAQTSVSVAPFTVDEDDPHALSADLLQAMATDCLSRNPQLAVVERSEGMQAMMAEKSAFMGASGLSAGRFVVTGSMAPLNGKWLVSLQASDPATTQTVAAYTALLDAKFYRDADSFCTAAISPFADILLHHAASPLKAHVQEDALSEQSTLLLKGIGHAQNGDYAGAFPFFLKVLDRDPENADACYWLAISYAKAGLMTFAQKQAAQCFAQSPAHPKRKELESVLAPASSSSQTGKPL